MKIICLPAFRDNYIWLLQHDHFAVVIDPGVAAPVSSYLTQHGLTLQAILLTHHHSDHIGGVADLIKNSPIPVYGPANEAIAETTIPLKENDQVVLPDIGMSFQVLDVPGHTLGHIAYYGANTLFCGDTLFACGCGRLFEGSPEQMWTSLSKLALLPRSTQVYCAHEYTQSNIAFALAVDPENKALKIREKNVLGLRIRNEPTIPSTLEEELATNPFLRCTNAAIVAAAELHAGKNLETESAVFTALREWKNKF